MMQRWKNLVVIFLGLAAVVFIVSCSGENVLEPSRNTAEPLSDGPPDFKPDTAFWGTISSIDYEAETFTLTDRPETILIDENTIIWARIGNHTNIAGGVVDPGSSDGDGTTKVKFARDTIFTFTDLAVGFKVRVKVQFVDEATLYAGSVKLLNCYDTKCVVFADNLATMDVPTRLVTFETSAWTGEVCPGAILTGAAGESLTLGDFSPGDPVTVKGFVLAEETLRISEMTIVE